MKVIELYGKLDELIPKSLSCSWDNDGLMCCPEPDREVRRVLFSLDVTERVVDYAVKVGADVIISHHPIIFRPIKSIASPKLVKLIKSGITVMSFHTRLDALDGGVNTVLADLLGVKSACPFSSDGIGLIGELDTELSASELISSVKEALGSKYIEAVISDRPCKRVALVGGDGKDCLADAVSAGCDTFITGSMSYNSLTDAGELGINVIAAGHYYTENPVLSRLLAMVEEIDGSISSEILASDLIDVF